MSRCEVVPTRLARCGRGIAATLVAVSALVVCCNVMHGSDTLGGTTVERLVAEAQKAEANGDAAGRYSLLRQAVRINPNYQLARWQLGQVQVDGEWLAIEEAQRRASADPQQTTYRALRDEYGETPDGQLVLARWCRKNKLSEEARYHWSSVLSIVPNHTEALRSLKLRWHDGRLLSREQIKQSKQETVDTRRERRRWSAVVAAWQRELSKNRNGAPSEILEEIRAVEDVAAIPSFERVTIENALLESKPDESISQLSMAFIDALDAMSDPAATMSLAKHGVQSPFSKVRDEAIERLGKRPLHEFVPPLLEGLVARIESSVRVVNGDDGSVQYLHSMYREGPLSDLSHRVSRSIYQPATTARIAMQLASDNVELAAQGDANRQAAIVSAAGAARSARRYEEQIVDAEREIATSNEANAASNARIIYVLTATTDQNLGTEPRAWWDWWQDDTEYLRTDTRPVYETQDISSEYVPVPAQAAKECFASGTPVWTKTGQRPIESLALGELVLAQNVDTGELAYKPVIGRTIRPPSEILKLKLAGEEIRTTRGHLFWVPGDGWKMAKELEIGSVLLGVSGSQRMNAIESSDQAEAFNLVVADFNTYFVGESGVLVHDNTPRTPTRATVPGLAAK